MPGILMPIPHFHDRCIQGDIDITFHHREFAQRSADAENNHLGTLLSEYPGHRAEVIECNESCLSSDVDIHRRQRPDA